MDEVFLKEMLLFFIVFGRNYGRLVVESVKMWRKVGDYICLWANIDIVLTQKTE